MPGIRLGTNKIMDQLGSPAASSLCVVHSVKRPETFILVLIFQSPHADAGPRPPFVNHELLLSTQLKRMPHPWTGYIFKLP